MALTKDTYFLDLAGLQNYDKQLKDWVDSAKTLSIKTVLKDGDTIKFYRKPNATAADTADASIVMPAAATITGLENRVGTTSDLNAYKAKSTLTDILNVLTADDTTDGSMAKAIKDAIDALTAKDIEITAITGLNKGEAAAANVQEALEALNTKASANAEAAKVSVIKDEDSGEYAAVYHVTQNGVNVGVPINIAKDKVVKSGAVITNPSTDAEHPGTWIKIELQNTEDVLWINAAGLIEYVTSGSVNGDMVFVTVDPTTHKVTATLTDGTVTKAKLDTTVQASLDKADAALPQTTFDTYKSTNDAAVAANADAIKTLNGNATTAGSVAKAVADAKTELKGAADDTADSETIKGAKLYADSLNTAMDSRVDTLEKAVGEGGSVSTQINNAIADLDATVAVKGTPAKSGVMVVTGVTETDGKLTAVAEAEVDPAGAAAQALTDAKAYADTKKSEVLGDATTATAGDATVQGALKSAAAAQSTADANKAAIEKLNGDATVKGSVDNKIATQATTTTTELGKKADKVTGATAGNFAGLDANGNLTDSGKKAADFDAVGAADTVKTEVLGSDTDESGAATVAGANKAAAAAKTAADNAQTAADAAQKTADYVGSISDADINALFA